MDVSRARRELDSETGSGESPLHAERVALTLEQLQQSQRHLQDMEARLSALTRECASILEQWSRTDERHAAALATLQERLNGWNEIERRMLSESAARLQQFERNVLHEWHVLRQKHEEPILRLDAQAARIRDTCLEAVDSALKGFDRAEARLAALEESLQAQMDELTRELRGTVAVLQGGESSGRSLPARPWALEEVVRLHGQMRAEADDRGGHALAARGAEAAPLERAPGTADADPVAPFPADLLRRRRPWVLAAAAIVVLLFIAGYGWSLQRQLRAGLTAATSRAEAAERSAVTAERARADALEVQRASEQRIRAAEEAATTARLTAGIMTAPDLVRLDFVPRTVAPGARGHLLWSRTRGSVMSASRLPRLPAQRTFQLWLQSRNAPISAGTFAADDTGSVTATFDAVEGLPRPVVGAWVSMEPEGGSAQPTGPVVLTTLPDAPSAP